MSENLRILVTNDDGVDAPGFAIALNIARALSQDVWGVGPAHNQSGSGHRFTLGHEMEIDQRSDRLFAIPGSPADSVVVAFTHILSDHPPDIVISGVNNGQNLGDILNASGTVAGAREAALQGALGIALSQGVDYEASLDVEWDCVEAHGASVVSGLIAEADRRSCYYNVNFPVCDPAQVSGVRVVPHERFQKSPFRYYPSRNEGKFFVAIPETPRQLNHDRDFYVLLHDKAITVTPLALDQSDPGMIAHLGAKLHLGSLD
jgi:5'-nucleotidase